MVLLSIIGRLLHFPRAGHRRLRGLLHGGGGFLALAHTLKRGEHIRVTLLLDHT
jgi:TRAP-type mannitol/chloroaromatic compound transport system permease small subunit